MAITVANCIAFTIDEERIADGINQRLADGRGSKRIQEIFERVGIDVAFRVEGYDEMVVTRDEVAVKANMQSHG